MPMNHQPVRRDFLKGSFAVLIGASGFARISSAAKGGSCEKSVAVVKPVHKDFYNADGSLNEVAVKEAYYSMMERFNYPISDNLRTSEFWVCDFLQGDLPVLGMGGVFWINATGFYGKSGDQAYKGDFKGRHYGYLGHEIYLLPGQMLPEHRHVGGPDGHGPKMESWQVRYGSVDFFGEHRGEGSEALISDLPERERPWGYGQRWFKSKYIAKRTAKSGKPYTLEDPESWHFQRAGAQGAIVTEYATYHNHVEFSKPGMKFANTTAKR